MSFTRRPHRLGHLSGLLALAAAVGVASPARADDEPSPSPSGDQGVDSDGEGAAKPNKKSNGPYDQFAEVHADDWFTLSGPKVELHGYLRVRSELFHNFSLSRLDAARYDALVGSGSPPLWPQPPDNDYVDTGGNEHRIRLCGSDPTDLGPCESELQAGANLRLRLEPSISISDNLRIRSQIDLLDNIVLGSTPQGYANAPGDNGGYQVVARGGYTPIGAFSTTAWAPASGVTTIEDAVLVKRVWGEYASPIGTIAFGRMPHQWGLGMVHNAGDGHDSDWQSTVDRLMFTTGFPDWNLYISAAWDFANEGVSGTALHSEVGCPTDPGIVDDPNAPLCDPNDLSTSGTWSQEGEPYDFSTKDDLDEWVLMVVHRMDNQLAAQRLARGLPVVDAGLYLSYQQQELAQETIDPAASASLGQQSSNINQGFVRRGYEAVMGDLWLKLRYRKVRVEVEGAFLYGSVENTLRDQESDYDNLRDPLADGWTIRQFGIAAQTQWNTLEDRLRLGFGFGYATGDDDVASLAPSQSASSGSSIERQLTLDRTYSTFRFHPDYRVDLILFRNILRRVQGAYYFRPSLDYDFLRDPDGQRVGGGAAVIWSRASEPVQAPGHAPDLGLEIDLKLFYQISPGNLRADVEEMGGFYTAVEYGVLFPLDGLGYLPGEVDRYATAGTDTALDVDPAQIARWYLGIMF